MPDNFVFLNSADLAGDAAVADGATADIVADAGATGHVGDTGGFDLLPASDQAGAIPDLHDADGSPSPEAGSAAPSSTAISHTGAAETSRDIAESDHQTSGVASNFAPLSDFHADAHGFTFANFVASEPVFSIVAPGQGQPVAPQAPSVQPAELAAISLAPAGPADGPSSVLVNGDGEIVSALSSSAPGSAGSTGGSAGSATPATGTGAASTSPFVINVIYDASVSNAPAAFKTEVAAAVQYFESQFTDHVTINIDVGYGEVGGYTLGAGALGESLTYLNSYSYAQVKGALTADAKSADDATAVASLPTNSPVSGTFWESTAEAKATGLLGASSNIDGYVGFASGNLFDYDNSNGVTSGQYDFFGVVAHEISEVMGRGLLAGGSIGGTPNGYYPLDLFHFSANGVHDFSGTTPGYFSVNNGATNLDNFNTNPGGDFGDWASSAGNDAFLAFSPSGVVDGLSPTDLRELDVLGWDRASTTGTPAPAAQPDLVVTGFAFNGAQLSYHVSNVGAGTAAASTAGIYASTSATASGTLIGTIATGALAAGASDTESGTLSWSAGSTPTTYYVSVTADYKNVVAESNEGNNQSQKIAIVLGTSGANVLTGTAGNDVIMGLGGNDTLTGGAGADQFVFNTALNKTTNVATITDFSHAQGDKIDLSHTIFAALTQGVAGTPLAANNFYASANGADHLTTDHILYNTTTGALSYDVDGTGAAVPVQFAILANHPTLTAADFILV